MSTKKKYNKVVTEITMLTVEKAKSLLDGQFTEATQRKLSTKHIMIYSDAIDRGLWMFDGMPIRVDWFGQMFDGQHRCKAVLRTKKPVKILIIYGLDPNVYKVCDRGKTRTMGDALRREGEVYYNQLAGALTLLIAYKKGIAYECAKLLPIQVQDVLNLLKSNPDLRISAKRVQSVGSVLAPTIAAFLHYVFSQKSREKANIFFEKLASGEGFKKKDPIRLLRDRLLFNKTEAIKMDRGYKIAIAIKAWNVFRQGGTMTKLSWRGPKRRSEEMPKIM